MKFYAEIQKLLVLADKHVHSNSQWVSKEQLKKQALTLSDEMKEPVQLQRETNGVVWIPNSVDATKIYAAEMGQKQFVHVQIIVCHNDIVI